MSKDSEHMHQANLFVWAGLVQKQRPEMEAMYAIPNGGDRRVATGARLKREGVKPGVPDVHLPVARGGHASLYIEMKAEGGRVSKAQEWWHEILRKYGHCVKVCLGFNEARRTVEDYLDGKIIREEEMNDEEKEEKTNC